MKKLFSFLLSILSSSIAFGDGVVKVMDLPYSYLNLNSVEVFVKIDYQIASVITRQRFSNDYGEDVRLKYGFPLDINASLTNVFWLKHGTWYQGEIVARPQDDSAVNPGGEIDQLFLDYLGESPFFLSFQDSLARDSAMTIELSYIQLLEFDSSKIYFRYPLNMEELITGRLDSFKINLEISKEYSVSNVECTSHFPNKISETDTSFIIKYTAYDILPNKDFLLNFQTQKNDLDVIVYSHKPENEDGYFMMITQPSVLSDTTIENNLFFIFAIDVSGSMAGDKLDLAKHVVKTGIEKLSENDEFSIVQFYDGFELFSNYPVNAIQANKNAAQTYIDGLTPGGKTNITLGISQAMSLTDLSENNSLIILVTDGQAKQDFSSIVMDKRVPVFVWGIGPAPNRVLLNYLVGNFNGFAVYPREDNCERCLNSFYKKIRSPYISEVTVTWNTEDIEQIYPQYLPGLFEGEQFIQTGRYQAPRLTSLSISGYYNDSTPFNRNFTAELKSENPGHLFVKKFWAKQKIEDILLTIDQLPDYSGLIPSLIEEIVALSLEYGVLTPFTSYLDPGEPTSVVQEENRFWDFTENESPDNFKLLSNFPNPFNATTKIPFVVYKMQMEKLAVITIFDVLGNFVWIQHINFNESGVYQINWAGESLSGESLASGVYFVRLKIGNQVQFTKMLLIR